MWNREIDWSIGVVVAVLSAVIAIIVFLLIVAVGDGMQSVAAIGAIGAIVSATLQFLDRRVGRDAMDREPD
ncbi:hypothetical protein AB0J82_13065 [Asanoa sp. NPDC049518]|uniref:hypothetical protein n=1 Tax=unclassified Asanoa TaxID=2685164 RepID=UPI00341F292F